MVHRLVAEAFLDNPNNLPIVHHKNRDKLDNRLENLQWVSYQDNIEERTITTRTNQYVKDTQAEWRELYFDTNYLVSDTGLIANKATGRILQGTIRNGYRRVTIQGKQYSVHLLVYETYIAREHGIIDHIDGDRCNNHITNLRDTTQSENINNAMRLGHRSQVRVQQLDNNFKLLKEYPSFSDAARTMGVTYAAIKSAADRGGKSCGYYWKRI
jgi:hypothetical protein